MESLSNTLSANDELLSRLVVFPLPEFPTRKNDGLLEQLLRKKLAPVVEDWIQGGLDTATGMETLNDDSNPTSRQDLEELWDWAPNAFRESFLPYTQVLGGNYTLEERVVGIENVVTGLVRELPDNQEEAEEESDDEDQDEMKDDPKPKPMIPQSPDKKDLLPLSIEDQLKYMITGVLPFPTQPNAPG